MPLHENLSHAFLNHDKQIDKFTVDAAIVSNGYVDLSQAPHSGDHLFLVINGSLLNEGAGNDYVLSGQRITFSPLFGIATGDFVMALYKY